MRVYFNVNVAEYSNYSASIDLPDGLTKDEIKEAIKRHDDDIAWNYNQNETFEFSPNFDSIELESEE